MRTEFIDIFLEALGWDVRNVQGRGEHDEDVIHKDAIRVGGMVGLRRAVARWRLRGIIGWGVVFDELMGGQMSIYSVVSHPLASV